MRTLVGLLMALVLCSCAGVTDKVLSDFGLREKPEGYVTGSDKAEEQLAQIGPVELKRLNLENREGTVQFEEGQGLQGKFYKEVKKYEKAYPIEAQASSKAGPGSDAGYVGYVDYEYRVYQSERRSTRTEAAALDADIRTDTTGRERYRYTFTAGARWDGGEGERVKR